MSHRAFLYRLYKLSFVTYGCSFRSSSAWRNCSAEHSTHCTLCHCQIWNHSPFTNHWPITRFLSNCRPLGRCCRHISSKFWQPLADPQEHRQTPHVPCVPHATKDIEETWRKILTKPNSLYLRDFPEAIVANIANIAIMSHSHFGQWVIRASSMLEKSSVKCTSPEPTSANKDETCSNMLFNAR